MAEKNFDVAVPGGRYFVGGQYVDANGKPLEAETASTKDTGPTVPQIKAKLDELGVTYPSGALKPELLELLAAATASTEAE